MVALGKDDAVDAYGPLRTSFTSTIDKLPHFVFVLVLKKNFGFIAGQE